MPATPESPSGPGAPRLRPATPADVPTAAGIWHAGWHAAHAGHVPEGLTAARTLSAFEDRMRTGLADTTVAEDAGSVVGFFTLEADELAHLFIALDRRGSDLAAVLLAASERALAEAGYVEAWLAVVAGNARARRFYEKHGWRDQGDLPYEVHAGGATYFSPCRRYVKVVA